MPNITFTDNNAFLSNPDRGFILDEKVLYNNIDNAYYHRWDSVHGDLDMMWFQAPPMVHEVGLLISWLRNGVVVGTGQVIEWTNDFNVVIKTVSGVFPQASDKLQNFQISAFDYVNSGFTWKDIEPTQGVYNWTLIDQIVGYQFCISNNKKMNIRFTMDQPTTTAHRDIPDWLYTAMGGSGVAGAEYSFDEVGTMKYGFSPNYSNATMIARHALVIAAIKNRYGPYIQTMEIGSVGHWGELHTYPQFTGLGAFPSQTVLNQYVQHYLDNFDRRQLLMRRPFNIAKDNLIGIYFDMLGGPDHLYAQWWGLKWIADNGYTDDYGNVIAAYPNYMQVAPTSAEHDPWVDNNSYEADFSNNATGRNYTRMLQMARDLELTFLRGQPLVHLYRTDGIAVKANVENFRRRLGYRFILKSFTYTVNGANLDISVQIENAGIARCYKNYPVFVEYYDSNNNFISRQNLNINLTSVLRETTQTFSRSVPYPTCNKIAFKIEGVSMPINAPTIGDGAYTMFTANLSGPVIDTPIGTAKVAKGGPVMEPLPLYATNAASVVKKALRIQAPTQTTVFDLVDITDPNASALRVSTSSGIKAAKK